MRSDRNDDGASDASITATGPNQSSQLAQRHFDPTDNGELTTAIVYAIAEAEGIHPLDLKSPPLYDVIDAPALEATFFGPKAAGRHRHGVGTVEFQYLEYLVTVRSDGWIRVYEETSGELE